MLHHTTNTDKAGIAVILNNEERKKSNRILLFFSQFFNLTLHLLI